MVGLLWMSVFLGLWIGTPFLGEGIIVFREFPGRVLISLPYAFSVFAGLGAVVFVAFSVAQYRGNAGRFSTINAWLKWLALLPAAGVLGLPYAPQLGTFLHIFVSPGIVACAALKGFCAESFGMRERRGLDWALLLVAGTLLFSVLGGWVSAGASRRTAGGGVSTGATRRAGGGVSTGATRRAGARFGVRGGGGGTSAGATRRARGRGGERVGWRAYPPPHSRPLITFHSESTPAPPAKRAREIY